MINRIKYMVFCLILFSGSPLFAGMDSAGMDSIKSHIDRKVAERTKDIRFRHQLNKNAYALLLSMYAFNSVAQNAARQAAEVAVTKSASAVGIDGIDRIDRMFASAAARRSNWSASSAAAESAACYAATDYTATDYAARQAASAAAEVASEVAAEVAAEVASELNWMPDLPGINRSSLFVDNGQRAYQLAEEKVLAYFSEKSNFDTVFNAAFDAALNEFQSYSLGPESGIFRSQKGWDTFKSEHFRIRTPKLEAEKYLDPWLGALDTLFLRLKPNDLRSGIKFVSYSTFNKRSDDHSINPKAGLDDSRINKKFVGDDLAVAYLVMAGVAAVAIVGEVVVAGYKYFANKSAEATKIPEDEIIGTMDANAGFVPDDADTSISLLPESDFGLDH